MQKQDDGVMVICPNVNQKVERIHSFVTFFFTVNSQHLESSAYPNHNLGPLKGVPAFLVPGT